MARLYLDICLSDIPKERIKTASNGKKYLKAIINPRKETDRDGYDHYIAAFIPKEEREEDDRPLFIGRAQEKMPHTGGSDFRREARQNEPPAPAAARKEEEDLPFDYRPGHSR